MNPVQGLTNMFLRLTEQVRVTPICSFPYRFLDYHCIRMYKSEIDVNVILTKS